MSKIKLSHSNFIRSTDTAVADASVNESIQEMVDDIPNQSLQVANSASELENLLDK